MNSQTAQARGPKRHRVARLAVAAAALGAGFAVSVAALPSPAGAASAVTVKLVGHGSLGKILVNRAGMTVYLLTSDPVNKATCTGGCASVWPPVTIPKGTKPNGGPGLTQLGTVASGGKLQLTWNKHPLYTYVLDTAPGDARGNGVKQGSGTWFAASAKHASAGASAGAAKTKTSGSSGSSGGSGGYGY